MTEQPNRRIEIHARGRISLGEELRLEEVVKHQPAEVGVGLPIDTAVSPTEIRRFSSLTNERVAVEMMGYELKPTGKPIHIEDPYLVRSYGILGSPGSGKTHLLRHLLRQIVEHERQDPERKFGGLILDPTAGLIDDIRKTFQLAGREQDLIVVNTRELRATEGLNILDCGLAPADLGDALVLAAQSAGLESSDPCVLHKMSKVFGAILTLMRVVFPDEVPTLAKLIHLAVGSGEGRRPVLERLIDSAKERLRETIEFLSARSAVATIREWLDDDRMTARTQFMDQAFRTFRSSENACYSAGTRAGGRNAYDRIIDEGKFILVSMGPQEVMLSALLPALMKLIFQRTVLSRFDRYVRGELHNSERPVLFMADEYHTVATQIPGLPGDSQFFSLAWQVGALCIVATPSVQQLAMSPLKEAWNAVLDVMAAVIFMAGADPATDEYIRKRAGNKEGIPPGMRQRLKPGQAIVIGNTTRQETSASVKYLQVPPV